MNLFAVTFFRTATGACVAALAVLVLMTSTTGAQTVGWVQRSVAGPGPLTSHSMAYDSGRGVSVLFGGYYNGWRGETWEWDGAAWSQRLVSGPAPRNIAAMAYDSARNETVLFGGFAATAPFYKGDTWVWNGTTWTEISVSGPSPRGLPAMAYDSARGVMVLFGGYAASGLLGDTWEWDGSSWTQRAVPGPSARQGHRMEFDSTRGVVVLFGGQDVGGIRLGDTWEWDGNSWTQRSNAGPSPRGWMGTAFDSSRSVVVLFGGYEQFGTRYDDTWEWNGNAWSQRVIPGPPARESHSMVYDSVRGMMVVYGGGIAGDTSEQTWELCPAPSILTQPVDQSICGSGAADFVVTAAAFGTISYQWEIEAPSQPGVWTSLSTTPTSLACGGTAHASTPDAASTSISVSRCAGIAAYRVRCAISGECGVTNSDAALLTFDDSQGPPRIGGALSYEASLGTLPAAQGWTNAFGGTGSAVVNSARLDVSSNNCIYGYLRALPFLWADGQVLESRVRVPTGSVNLASGLRATYFGAADDDGIVVYAWLWSTGVALSTHNNADPGPGLATMLFDAASAPHTYRIATNTIGATLSIDGVEQLSLPYTNTDPVFRDTVLFGNDSRDAGLAQTEWQYVQFGSAGQPLDAIACSGENALFSVTAMGTGPFTYQWRRNATAIDTSAHPSATTATLTLTGVSVADAGLYDCIVSNACASTTSAAAILTVNSADFNGDGDTGTDADIEAFFACLGGNCCPACGTPDFNADGDTGTDADIESFFRVLAGGPC